MGVVKNDNKQLSREVKQEINVALEKIKGIKNSAAFVMINDGKMSGISGYGEIGDLILGIIACMEGDDVVADVMCNAVINYYRDKKNLPALIEHLQKLQ